MVRDTRRGRGQWRGCHALKDSMADATSTNCPKRAGGLRMGQTYYYYYEVDGSTETYDLAMPSTTACPYLPGQVVNTLDIPVEHTLRKRSVSLSSMRQEDFRTMDPEAKFVTPRPAPLAAADILARRLGTASPVLHHRSSCRSLSPAPSWKRFFSRKLASRDASRDAERSLHKDDQSVASFAMEESRSRSSTPTEGTRTRDISPEALRRFLSEDIRQQPEPTTVDVSKIEIPEDIVEEADDDDNFATSATIETQFHPTGLSPPPFRRAASSNTLPITAASSSCLTLIPAPCSIIQSSSQARDDVEQVSGVSLDAPPSSSSSNLSSKLRLRWSLSTSDSTTTPLSPTSVGDEPPSFYDSNDDEDVLSSNDGDNGSYKPTQPCSPLGTFEGYKLPQQIHETKHILGSQTVFTTLNSPQLAQGESNLPINGTNLSDAPTDTDLDDFVSELGWMVDVIGIDSN